MLVRRVCYFDSTPGFDVGYFDESTLIIEDELRVRAKIAKEFSLSISDSVTTSDSQAQTPTSGSVPSGETTTIQISDSVRVMSSMESSQPVEVIEPQDGSSSIAIGDSIRVIGSIVIQRTS